MKGVDAKPPCKYGVFGHYLKLIVFSKVVFLVVKIVGYHCGQGVQGQQIVLWWYGKHCARIGLCHNLP
jgi:hypothetical protein